MLMQQTLDAIGCSQSLMWPHFNLRDREGRRTVLLLLAALLPVGALCAIPDLVATSVLLPARVYLRSKGEPGRLTSCMALAVGCVRQGREERKTREIEHGSEKENKGGEKKSKII
uniref:Uncharacterized protein n=1 Tax=Oryza brachyantha TaxID=4533 RepID=J3N413_ORYBR